MERISSPELIRSILECAIACENCVSACLANENSDFSRCIELNRDCADICTLAARLLQRSSGIITHFLMVCEEITRFCAEECSKYNMDACRYAADACLKCAEHCSIKLDPITQ
jgi:hypothetical protein